jgi:hypothetical protein
MEFEFVGLTASQLLTLAGIGVLLLVALLVLRAALKLAKTFLKLGCLGILVLLIIAFFALRAMG